MADEVRVSRRHDEPPTPRRTEPSEEGATSGVRAELLATIHERIVPQLVLAHRQGPDGALDADARTPPTAEELTRFCRIVTSQDLSAALAFIESMLVQGLRVETILLHLIGATARQLWAQWLADPDSIADVFRGLGTLQDVVHFLGPTRPVRPSD